ncbi:hypothetical protein CLOHYLEM_05258 [[Clostridium] hylemonae DSM 15053]|uniref:Uncharacterized protein n=1 Tax=[Clostridium] hylemonae DSM 15053 TaxID=553973 RepID=C0BZL7_9FIRM|nr:hypothetical protein CLOHYLEM_05258 [[Clostridium] hylemonae DSM 15053]
MAASMWLTFGCCSKSLKLRIAYLHGIMGLRKYKMLNETNMNMERLANKGVNIL